MHLVDHARAHIEDTYKRPFFDRVTRSLLANILPSTPKFRIALLLAKFGKPFAKLFKAIAPLKPLGAMLDLAPAKMKWATRVTASGTFSPKMKPTARVALLTGCAQPALDTGINAATIALFNRLGIEVVLPEGEACCGSLVHHMGREEQALSSARNMVDVWTREIDDGGLDAIIITTSGCGTTIKDYGYMLRHDEAYAEKAKRVSALAKDVSEYLATQSMPEPAPIESLKVAYHAACSLQHGQKIKSAPKQLLRNAGFDVTEIAESHLCCGSAGTYNILQSEIAGQLRDRKVANIEKTKADVVAAGNIGCLTQIGSGTKLPVVHTIKLLNWAYGGEKPAELK